MKKKWNFAFRSDVSTVSENRSLILMGFGAVIGLLLAGYALFTARGTSTIFVPPEDVAIVNQQPISRIDFIAQIQALFGVDLIHSTAEQRKKTLDDMIREELFVQRGKELDVATSDAEVRSAMVNAVELEIAADVISSQPDDAKLQSYYQTHEANYASEGIITVDDYVAHAPATDSVSAARHLLVHDHPSNDTLSHLGFAPVRTTSAEEYYFAAQIHLGDRLYGIARELDDGQVSAPITMADGVHILRVVKNMKPVRQDFAMARDHVLNDYRKDAIGRLRTGDENYLRKRAHVLIADDMR